MALDPAAELAKGEHLLVADGARRLVHGVQQRRGVALREDEVVVARVVRRAEVVVQVLADQHRHQVGGGHRRGRMPGAGGGAGSDASRRAAAAPARAKCRGRPLLLREGPQVPCRVRRQRARIRSLNHTRQGSLAAGGAEGPHAERGEIESGPPSSVGWPLRVEVPASRASGGSSRCSRPGARRSAGRGPGCPCRSARRPHRTSPGGRGCTTRRPRRSSRRCRSCRRRHGATLGAARGTALWRRGEALLREEFLLGRGEHEVDAAVRTGEHLIGIGHAGPSLNSDDHVGRRPPQVSAGHGSCRYPVSRRLDVVEGEGKAAGAAHRRPDSTRVYAALPVAQDAQITREDARLCWVTCGPSA